MVLVLAPGASVEPVSEVYQLYGPVPSPGFWIPIFKDPEEFIHPSRGEGTLELIVTVSITVAQPEALTLIWYNPLVLILFSVDPVALAISVKLENAPEPDTVVEAHW